MRLPDGRLAGVDGAVDQVRARRRARRPPRGSSRGQIVFDSTPTLMPSARSPSNSGTDVRVGEGVRLPGLAVGRPAPRRGATRRGRRRRSRRPRSRCPVPAAPPRLALALPAATPRRRGGAAASSSASRGVVDLGVAGTTGRRGRVVPGRQRAAPVEDDRLDGPVRRLMRGTTATRRSSGVGRPRPRCARPCARSLTSIDAVGQALADDHDRRHADQLGVLELHAGRGLAAVVVEHPRPGRLELARRAPRRASKTASSLPVATRWTSAGRDLARPAQPELVVGLLGDRGDGARDADAVGAHGDAC